MSESVLSQLSSLKMMDTADLIEMWNNLFQTPPANKQKPFLIRKISWRIQELAYGGLSEDTKAKLRSLQKTMDRSTTSNNKNMPSVGTQFIRHHGGEEHRVMALKDGFEYRGCKYKSLTAIATKITGTKWSGPKFFGLKE